MEPDDIKIPDGVTAINVSIDVLRTSNGLQFPHALPLLVKPGQRLIITTKKIFFEAHEESDEP